MPLAACRRDAFVGRPPVPCFHALLPLSMGSRPISSRDRKRDRGFRAGSGSRKNHRRLEFRGCDGSRSCSACSSLPSPLEEEAITVFGGLVDPRGKAADPIVSAKPKRRPTASTRRVSGAHGGSGPFHVIAHARVSGGGGRGQRKRRRAR